MFVVDVFDSGVRISALVIENPLLGMLFVQLFSREPILFVCCVAVFVNVWAWEHYYAVLLLPGAIVAGSYARADAFAISPAAWRIVMLVLFLLFIDVEATDVARLVTLASRIPNLTVLEHVELHLRDAANALLWPV